MGDCSIQPLANSKGVHREVESEGSWRQSLDLTNRKFLGFSFYCIKGVTRIRVHPKSLKRLKAKLKELTGRSIGIGMEARVNKLNQTIQGWVNYYILADMHKYCQKNDEWLRRRLRMCYWKQWKKVGARMDNLVRLGISDSKAWEFANTRKGYWRIADSPIKLFIDLEILPQTWPHWPL